MGKKRIVTQNTDELIKEREEVETAVRKISVQSPSPKAGAVSGVAHILATWNNTLISLSNEHGDVLAHSSAGAVGFKGTKKSTPFAASRVAEALAEKAKRVGVNRISVVVRGIGAGRESAIRSLASHGLDITSIRDLTPIPHNGPRPPKPRRV